MEGAFCVAALDRAVAGRRKPSIDNTDQGSQFTSAEWLRALESRAIWVSPDGRGHTFDNIFIDRLWRTVKWKHVFLREYRRECRSCRNCVPACASSSSSTTTSEHWEHFSRRN